MIKIENVEVYGWEAAVRGMRNPKNSWEKSDTNINGEEGCMGNQCSFCSDFPCGSSHVGTNDLKLMQKLANAGSDHGKFLRMINVTADIQAMQPWWMEFDTYKVGTVRNSCSKMHKIHVKMLTVDDFEHSGIDECGGFSKSVLKVVIEHCNYLREKFNETQNKKYWRALIELLPEGYLMRSTVQLNYEVLRRQYYSRKNHKLDEWKQYCLWIELLPYFREICLGGEIE